MYKDYAQSAGTGTDMVESSKATFRGDFRNCNYTRDKQKSLNMHRIKTRRKEPTAIFVVAIMRALQRNY